MKSRNIVFISVVWLVVALALGAVWFWLGGSKPESAPAGSTTSAPPQSGAAVAVKTPAAGAPSQAPADSQPAPWAGSSQSTAAQPGAAATTPKLTIAEREQRIKELEKMQAELTASMRPGSTPDPRQVDAALAKIQQINGSSQYAGINIDAVRNNLAKAQEMQAIAAQLDIEAKRPGGGDIKKIRVYVDQLQKAQSELRLDVSANANTTAVKSK